MINQLKTSFKQQESMLLGEGIMRTVEYALQKKNKLYSCNVTASHLKQAFQQVHKQEISLKRIMYHQKQFHYELCQNNLFKNLSIQNDLQNALMIRFPIYDQNHNYDHYVTIFRQTQFQKNASSLNKKDAGDLWYLVHSWQNVYSLRNWVFDVKIRNISEKLSNSNIDPINKLRDFIGLYNESWFNEFYKEKNNEKESIISRYEQIFSLRSNDHRKVNKIEWYCKAQ